MHTDKVNNKLPGREKWDIIVFHPHQSCCSAIYWFERLLFLGESTVVCVIVCLWWGVGLGDKLRIAKYVTLSWIKKRML